MSSNQQRYDLKFEQYTLVWLNETFDSEKIVEFMKNKLRRIINYVKIFQNVDECVNYISKHDQEHIYFLASGPSTETIITRIHEIQQIESIYILGVETQNSIQSDETSCKLRGIFDNPNALLQALQQEVSVKGIANGSSALLFSTLSSNAANRSNQQEADFMYFRLLTEVLVRLKAKESTKKEFFSICRSQYINNAPELKLIDDMEKEYSKEQAISFFTRASFLYRILNEALRTQDINMLFNLRFFVADLYNQLALLFDEQCKSMTLPTVVYRGQFISNNDFDRKIQGNINGFLSFNSFCSTSTNINVALAFAGNCATNDPNTKSVVFEITVEAEKSRRPFANIEHLSTKKDEDEVLFSMASVFRIQSIEYLSSFDVWLVRLLMNGEEDEELNALAKKMKEELGFTDTWSIFDNLSTNGGGQYEELFALMKKSPKHFNYEDMLHIFGGLLMQMGDLQNAEYYFRMLINDTQFDNSLMKVAYYTNLSLVCSEQKKYDAAISCAKEALQLRTIHPYLSAIIYTNLGSFYTKKRHATEAFEYLQKAENIFKTSTLFRNEDLSLHYVHMGAAYEMKQDFLKALEYFHKTKNILESSLPDNHPNLAMIYSCIGTNYMRQDKYDRAVFYLLASLDIRRRSLSNNHIDIVISYVDLGTNYQKLFNANSAYECFQKALEIISLSPNEPYGPNIMYVLGIYYQRENNLSKALDFYHNALYGEMRSMSPDYLFRIATYTIIAGVYDKQEKWRKAIKYYNNAIPLAMLHAIESVPELYFKIGTNYGILAAYNDCVRSLELALTHGRQILSENDPFLVKIQRIYDIMSLIANAINDKSSMQK